MEANLEELPALLAEVDLPTCSLATEVFSQAAIEKGVYMRHVQVTVDGQPYDIADEISKARQLAQGCPRELSVQSTLVHILPPGVKSLGWGTHGMQGTITEVEGDAAVLEHLRSAVNRQRYIHNFWPELRAARRRLLELSETLRDTALKQ